jgi:hypothetical protein
VLEVIVQSETGLEIEKRIFSPQETLHAARPRYWPGMCSRTYSYHPTDLRYSLPLYFLLFADTPSTYGVEI